MEKTSNHRPSKMPFLVKQHWLNKSGRYGKSLTAILVLNPNELANSGWNLDHNAAKNCKRQMRELMIQRLQRRVAQMT